MYEILFVDDDLDTAKEYAELVASFSKLRPIVCSTKAEALAAVKENPIAVAILDQKMPEISGTDLYMELLKINPCLRGIMLSGEADKAEIGEAMNLHYRRYLHKSEFRKLPAVVLSEFVKSQTKQIRDANFTRVHLFTVRHLFGIRGATQFWLESFFVEDEQFIPNDSWQLTDQINCGEKKQIKERFTLSRELRFEQNVSTEMSFNAEVAWKAGIRLKEKLGSVLRKSLHLSEGQKEEVVQEHTRDITLPQEPTNPTELYVRSRAFYWAPVYRRIQCHIGREALPMNEHNSVVITTLQPTGKIATKQLDTLSDGHTSEIFTGVHLI